MAAALSCSLAFITPFGHPVNIMVMTSGGYKLGDYLRVGAPLTLLLSFAILIGLKIFWGL
jgi:di/tricarboxylate transporter